MYDDNYNKMKKKTKQKNIKNIDFERYKLKKKNSEKIFCRDLPKHDIFADITIKCPLKKSNDFQKFKLLISDTKNNCSLSEFTFTSESIKFI